MATELLGDSSGLSFQALAAGTLGSPTTTSQPIMPESPPQPKNSVPPQRQPDADERGAQLLAAVANAPTNSSDAAMSTASAINALSMLLGATNDESQTGSPSRKPGRSKLKDPTPTASTNRQTVNAKPPSQQPSRIPPSIQKALDQANAGSPAPPSLSENLQGQHSFFSPNGQRFDQRRTQNFPVGTAATTQQSPVRLTPDQLLLLQMMSTPGFNQQQMPVSHAMPQFTNQPGMVVHWPPERQSNLATDLPPETITLVNTLQATASTLNKLVPVLHDLVARIKSAKRKRSSISQDTHMDDDEEYIPPLKRK